MGLDVKKVKERMDSKGRGGNPDRMKLAPKDNLVRIIPHTLKYFTESVDDIAFSYLIHFRVGPEGGKEAIVCPKTRENTLDKDGKPFPRQRCPVCELSAHLKKSTDTKDQTLSAEISVRRRFMINLIDLKNEETIAKGIQILECGKKIYEGIIQWCNEKWGDPLDFETGRNLIIHRNIPPSGDESRTEYKVEPEPLQSSIKPKLPSNWKEQIAKLETQQPAIKTYDEIKASLEGTSDSSEDSGVADDVPGQEGVSSQTETAVKVETAKKEKQAEAAKVTGGKPDCYGKLFSNRAEKCIACDIKEECKKEFLKP